MKHVGHISNQEAERGKDTPAPFVSVFAGELCLVPQTQAPLIRPCLQVTPPWKPSLTQDPPRLGKIQSYPNHSRGLGGLEPHSLHRLDPPSGMDRMWMCTISCPHNLLVEKAMHCLSLALFLGGGGGWLLLSKPDEPSKWFKVRVAGHGDAHLEPWHLGGRRRWSSVSSRPTRPT